MSEDIKKDYELHDREWYENYAKEHGYRLTKNADKVIEAIQKSYGYCPCRYNFYVKQGKSQEEFDKIRCVCQFLEQDMNECKSSTKYCHCHLFEKDSEENE